MDLRANCCTTRMVLEFLVILTYMHGIQWDVVLSNLDSEPKAALSGYILCLLAVASCGCTCVHGDRPFLSSLSYKFTPPSQCLAPSLANGLLENGEIEPICG
jgi:hypothetical protein